MLPLMPGPNPHAFGTLAVFLALGAGGLVVALAALLGFTALEIVCLFERYSDA